MDELRLQWKRREGGTNWTQRDYLNFLVNNISLSEKFGDLISCLGWTAPNENEKAVRRLLLEEPADFSNNRRSLYICPECGDLRCGAVSVIIENTGKQIVWRNFALEYDYSDELVEYRNLGTFTFDKANYEKVLKSAL